MANRLKTILHTVIDSSQSVFISNRLITNNIIVGYECLHKIKHRREKKKNIGQVALKLDISKAYDRMEWIFLR